MRPLVPLERAGRASYFCLLSSFTCVSLQSSKVKWRRRYRMLEQQQALVARLWDLHTQVKEFQGDREKKVSGWGEEREGRGEVCVGEGWPLVGLM